MSWLVTSIGLLAIILIGNVMSDSVSDSKQADERSLSAVTTGTNEFSKHLFKTIGEEYRHNVVISPLSAAIVLSMAAYGARGNTALQMKRILHLEPDNNVAGIGFQTLMDKLKNIKNVELRFANRIFVDERFPINNNYQKFTQDVFRSITQQIDFKNPTPAVNIINNFCNEQTQGRITNIVSEADIDPSTGMILLNAVYFKGEWSEKFNPQDTHFMPFYFDQNTRREVPTMYKQSEYNYGVLTDLKASFIELPYKGDEFSMVIILPREIDGLAELISKLAHIDIDQLLKTGRKQEVKLYLPKFKVESTVLLNSVLQKMGMIDLFSSSADFSGISNSPLKVSQVVQKAFIEVNEEGSEAAAVTAIKINRIAPGPPPIPPVEMKIDRPYYFVITHKQLNVIFFQGNVEVPQFNNVA